VADKTSTSKRAAARRARDEADTTAQPVKPSNSKAEQAKARERARQRAASDD
jgi:hypothetical protein